MLKCFLSFIYFLIFYTIFELFPHRLFIWLFVVHLYICNSVFTLCIRAQVTTRIPALIFAIATRSTAVVEITCKGGISDASVFLCFHIRKTGSERLDYNCCYYPIHTCTYRPCSVIINISFEMATSFHKKGKKNNIF